MNLHDYVLLTVENLLSHKENISLQEIKGDKIVFYQLKCHPEDLKDIIGREGATISALRRLFNVIGMRQGFKVFFEVIE
jgi:predicted RNA-binding protein YlqC (UPF0109 family)